MAWCPSFRRASSCCPCVGALAGGRPAASWVRVPQLDDCHRLSQTLRSENARLKDQMLACEPEPGLSERAVDDAAGWPSSRKPISGWRRASRPTGRAIAARVGLQGAAARACPTRSMPYPWPDRPARTSAPPAGARIRSRSGREAHA